MKRLHLDCHGGVAGDMLVAALVDVGANKARLEATVRALGLGDDVSFTLGRARKRGIDAATFTVHHDEHGHHHRSLTTIESIIKDAALDASVIDRAIRVFRRLGEAEAKIHGVPVEEIHFHEVGAVDAILDVVLAVTALDDLGVDELTAGPLPLGHGTITIAHGVYPLPAPATAALLEGWPTYGLDEVEGETVTPTGAALVTTLATFRKALPAMTISKVGYGAGQKDLPLPNVVRASLGEAHDERAGGLLQVAARMVEVSIDDMSPQLYEHLMSRLFEAGARDVSITPTVFKRGRPGHVVSVLVPDDAALLHDVGRILLTETTTLGYRSYPVTKHEAPRELVPVTTPFGPLTIKLGRLDGAVFHALPEYRECLAAAEQHGVPLKDVMAAAMDAWHEAQRS